MQESNKHSNNIYSEFTESTENYDSKNIDRSGWYDEFAQFDSLADYSRKYQDTILDTTTTKQAAAPSNTRPKGGFLSGIKDLFMNSLVDSGKSYKQLAEWVGPLDAHEVHERKIPHGFYYLSDDDSYSDDKENPAVVNESKDVSAPSKVNSKSEFYKDDTLSYWPSYNKISPKCRGAYLDWLASDRNHVETPLGYVFIYFSGLEYRVINENEKISNSEYIAIYKEVIRLYTIYGSNYSFGKYSCGFVNYLRALREPLINAYDKQYPIENTKIRNQLSPSIEVRVARKIANNEPITPGLAWLWLRRSGGYSLKTPYERLTNEFKTLFCLTYEKEHPAGIETRNNGSSLHMVYDPSNFAVARVMYPFNDLPNPSTFVIQMRKLTGIAERTNKQLEAVSRYLGKAGTSKDDLEAIIMMPKAIVDQMASEEKSLISDIQAWAQSVSDSNNGLTTTDTLWETLKQPLDAQADATAKNNKAFQKESRSLVLLLDVLGFGVAPDKRYHKEDMSKFEPLVVFKGAHSGEFTYSEAFDDAKSVISLAATIAKSNHGKNEDTTNQVMDIDKTAKSIMASIEKNIEIEDSQKPSLHAYALWRLSNKDDSIKLTPKKDHFKVIGNEAATADLIITTAFSDNIFNKHRIGKAEKVYAYLGGNKTTLPSLIHRLQTTGSANNGERNGSGLDFDKLRQYESETRSSANILNTVFAADDDAHKINPALNTESNALTDDINVPAEDYSILANNEVIPTTDLDKEVVLETDTASTDDNDTLIIDGLDVAHSSLYSQLVEKEVWRTSDVEAMCQSLDLMLSGAIEVINDWSYDNIDAAVVEEDDDDIVIDHDSVEELKNLN